MNFEDADFQTWNECPPLFEDAWMPLSQIPPNNTSFPCTLDNPNPIIPNPNPNHFDQIELNDQYFILNNTNPDDFLNDQYFLLNNTISSLEIPYVPPLPSLDTNDWTCNLPNTCNSLVEYQSPLTPQTNFINNEINFQTLENKNFEDADFHLWNECPPLFEDAWMPLSQIPPNNTSFPCTLDNPNPIPNPNPNHFDQIELNDQYFILNNTNPNDFLNDQFSTMVVTEGGPVQGHLENVNCKVREIKPVLNTKVPRIESIQLEEIRKYFDMPISKAAKELNVGLTVFKKRCRELKIMRWPHRKFKSLEAFISNVKEMGMMDVVQILEEHKKKLHFVPGLELTAETKKLRQACFKANYNKRRAALALTQ